MTWKVPGRTFGKPLSELMKDAQTTFQQDYIGGMYIQRHLVITAASELMLQNHSS